MSAASPVWQWIVNSVVDHGSPLGISREFFQNVLAGLLTAFVIAPLTALTVGWQEARKHRQLRRMLSGSLYLEIIVLVNSLDPFYRLLRDLALTSIVFDWLIDDHCKKDESARDVSPEQMEVVLPKVDALLKELKAIAPAKCQEHALGFQSVGRMADQLLKVCRKTEIEPIIKLIAWADRGSHNAQLIAHDPSCFSQDPERYRFVRNSNVDDLMPYLLERSDEPDLKSLAVEYEDNWRRISAYKWEIRNATSNPMSVNLDKVLKCHRHLLEDDEQSAQPS